MTMRPDQIGDEGQRWQVMALGYPDPDSWATVGWADTRADAVAMGLAIKLNPDCREARVIDRWSRK